MSGIHYVNDRTGAFKEATVVTPDNPLPVSIGTSPKDGSVDAFNRLRVSNPVSLFDAQLQYDLGPLFWYTDSAVGGTETHLPNESAVEMNVDSQNGSKLARQTKQYFRYQPGKSQMIEITYIWGTVQTNNKQCLGYFDNENGIFLQNDGGSLSWIRRTFTSGAAVDNKVEQADWNLDRFDGSGPSGITLDKTAANILLIDLEWLSIGAVRCGFVINGCLLYAHTFKNSNVLKVPYMTTANLPLRHEIINDAETAGASDFTTICCMVVSEGGSAGELGIPFGAGTLGNEITIDSNPTPIVSIRHAATFNGITNRATIELTDISFVARSNNVHFHISYDGTVDSQASWASVDSRSVMEVDTSAGAVTAGQLFGHRSVPAGQGQAAGSVGETITSKLPVGLDIDGNNPIVLTVIGRSFTGNASVDVHMNWKELR